MKGDDEISKLYDAILFDVDGVIIDSFDIKEQAFKDIYKRYGVENKIDISKGGRSRYEKFTYFHKEWLDINLKKEDLESLCNEYGDLVFEKVLTAEFIEGVKQFIERKYKLIDLYIVSGTPEAELRRLLEQLGLTNFFKSIHGPSDEKYIIIKKIVKDGKYKRALYIGDQQTDYENAMKAEVDFLGIGLPESFTNKDVKTIKDFIGV